MRLLIGHWNRAFAREEQNPPPVNLGTPGPRRKASAVARQHVPAARCGRFPPPFDFCSHIVHAAAMRLDLAPATPGQRLARGTCRHLAAAGFATVEEMPLGSGLRADVLALGPRGEVWIVECKSGLADYRADRKWQGYLNHCDRFFWAVDAAFPVAVLPEGTGLILADDWDAEVQRIGPETPLPGARRKAMLLRFARTAAQRLQAARDPGAAIALSAWA